MEFAAKDISSCRSVSVLRRSKVSSNAMFSLRHVSRMSYPSVIPGGRKPLLLMQSMAYRATSTLSTPWAVRSLLQAPPDEFNKGLWTGISMPITKSVSLGLRIPLNLPVAGSMIMRDGCDKDDWAQLSFCASAKGTIHCREINAMARNSCMASDISVDSHRYKNNNYYFYSISLILFIHSGNWL